jgi:hypothetical protein
MVIRDIDAFGHRDYKQVQEIAMRCALANKGESYAIYFDGRDLSVHHANARPPRYARCICVARHHVDSSIKLTFAARPDEVIKL